MNLTKYKQKHGDYVVVGEFSYLFEDGTRISGMDFPTIRAPSSPLQGRRDYVAAKLQKEKEAFKQFKEDCRSQGNWHRQNPSVCAPPPHDAAERLAAGKERIRALEFELQELDEKLAPSPEQQARIDAARKAEESRHRAVEQSMAAIEAVSLD